MSTPSPEQQQQMLAQLQQEMAMKNFQETMQSISSTCYTKCVQANRGGTRLDRGEQTCLANCMDRYLEVMSLVQKNLEEKSSAMS